MRIEDEDYAYERARQRKTDTAWLEDEKDVEQHDNLNDVWGSEDGYWQDTAPKPEPFPADTQDRVVGWALAFAGVVVLAVSFHDSWRAWM